jgi:hypothetical protein
MDQHERASRSRCYQIRADHGLAHARRGDEHTDVLAKESPCSPLLSRREPAFECNVQPLPFAALIFHQKGAAMFAKDLLEFDPATARERDVLR